MLSGTQATPASQSMLSVGMHICVIYVSAMHRCCPGCPPACMQHCQISLYAGGSQMFLMPHSCNSMETLMPP